MDQFIIFSIVVLFFAIIGLILVIYRKNDKEDVSAVFLKEYSSGQEKVFEKLTQLGEQNRELREQNKDLRQELDNKLSQAHKVSQNQISQTIKTVQGISSESAKLISDVTEKLTKLDETNKQVVNFSAQLQNLQDILKNPKQRGILGEYYLEETLKNVLPPKNYQMQYAFKDGTIVDAVVFVNDKVIPVDSKFSLENYEKILSTNDKDLRDKYIKQFKGDLKVRIDETSKYVKPGEDTMDFAFMFIPSESIYYDLLVGNVGGSNNINSRDLIDYAFKEKHVIIVSPTNFLAYLQTVLQGLRALQIEESAKSIKKNVEKLGRHILSYDDFLKKMGNSLGTTVNHFNHAYKEFKKIDKDVVKITDGETSIESLELDKPSVE